MKVILTADDLCILRSFDISPVWYTFHLYI